MATKGTPRKGRNGKDADAEAVAAAAAAAAATPDVSVSEPSDIVVRKGPKVTNNALAKMIAGQSNARDLVRLAEATGLEAVSLGGDKLWVLPERGLVIVGRVLNVETREAVDPGTGEVRAKRDFVIQLKSDARVLVRGSEEPHPDDGREIVKVDRDGVPTNYSVAQIDDVVNLTEVHQIRCLADLVGSNVAVYFLAKKPIKGGRKIWQAAVFRAPEGADLKAMAKTVG